MTQVAVFSVAGPDNYSGVGNKPVADGAIGFVGVFLMDRRNRPVFLIVTQNAAVVFGGGVEVAGLAYIWIVAGAALIVPTPHRPQKCLEVSGMGHVTELAIVVVNGLHARLLSFGVQMAVAAIGVGLGMRPAHRFKSAFVCMAGGTLHPVEMRLAAGGRSIVAVMVCLGVAAFADSVIRRSAGDKILRGTLKNGWFQSAGDVFAGVGPDQLYVNCLNACMSVKRGLIRVRIMTGYTIDYGGPPVHHVVCHIFHSLGLSPRAVAGFAHRLLGGASRRGFRTPESPVRAVAVTTVDSIC